ncbi:MAG: FAD-dependent oxidoreductase, partial [Candidatus Paceibacterota bacterium]
IIKDLYGKKTKKRITLFYSNKRKEDIVFYKELNEISKKWKNLDIVYALTRDENKDPQIKERKRIDAEMLKKYLKDLSSGEYFICGPSAFVTGIKDQLEKVGVGRNSIKTEAFY